jgi:hypothetical protein
LTLNSVGVGLLCLEKYVIEAKKQKNKKIAYQKPGCILVEKAYFNC